MHQLVVASDFGGEHKAATHLLYVYLVVATGLEDWTHRMAALRRETLGDRTMAYKKLGDGVRQAALPEFLSAAADLDGHLVAIAVDKRQKWLSTQPGVADELRRAYQLQCPWNPRALEALMRKAHFLALLLSVWAPVGAHITWLTDQDEFVANDRRHDDALLAAGRLSSMYLDQPMGVFALNTTAQDSEHRHFEDLCSVADLAAGVLSDVRAGLPPEASWDVEERRIIERDLPVKARILLSWFADRDMRLRKSLISIDYLGAQSMVRELWTESNWTPETPEEDPAVSI
ncbi:hypothetical protein ACO2Q0_20175 [Phenylobacterium sp. VNQ135]|uniref:hypothetical protein n=1 Tax=Phenylobacterium sp. VNQ135 TaxID=3400922 RepID=UPI003C0EAD46